MYMYVPYIHMYTPIYELWNIFYLYIFRQYKSESNQLYIWKNKEDKILTINCI